MKWESNSGYLPVPSEKEWGITKESGFGGKSILDASNDELMHYGVPGMRWGVRAKEYVSKKIASYKSNRQAEKRRQIAEGYEQGRRAASNTYFIKKRVAKILSDKRKQEEAKKGSFVDRTIDKGFDKAADKIGIGDMLKGFGLDEKAKDFLKDFKNQKVDAAYDWMQTDKGKKHLQNVANFIGKSTSKAIGAGRKAAPYVKKGAESAGRALSKAGKQVAKTAAKSVKAGYKWLHEGNPSGSQKIKMGVKQFEQAMSKYLGKGADAIAKSASYSHKGARSAHESLGKLLSKRPRRS